MDSQQYSVSDLVRVMERLRDPLSGCPWDIGQNFRSIVPSTLEECYELVQAIEDEDFPHVEEELGDVLFQVIFYSQLGKELGLFSFPSIVSRLVEKLIRRHPHVFGGGKIEGVVDEPASLDDVRASWEVIKQAERDEKREKGILADIPMALPALTRAQKLQKRAAQVDFDWSDTSAVLDKMQEELNELRQAMEEQDTRGIHEEMGDVLFTGVNLARHLGLDAEESLRQSSGKFQLRFERMESMAEAEGLALFGLNDDQLESLWQRAKA